MSVHFKKFLESKYSTYVFLFVFITLYVFILAMWWTGRLDMIQLIELLLAPLIAPVVLYFIQKKKKNEDS